MKLYIKSDTNVSVDPIKALNYFLGFTSYNSMVERRTKDKCNFALVDHMYRLSEDFVNKYKTKLRDIGAKYITPNRSWGVMYFYIDENKLAAKYAEAMEAKRKEKEEADARLMEKLNAVDIDQYKPTQAIIDKLINYRNKGSRVNVKAIKDVNKVITYYYAAALIGWEDLKGDCYDKLCRLGADYQYFANRKQYEDIFQAIDRRVKSEESYADPRNEMSKKLDLPNTDLFTFEERNCWLPKSILMFFINNDIPVHFGRRTSGANWDTNGRQWSEVEHLTLYPDSENPINYNIVVHTNEGGGAHTYTGFGPYGRTDARTSAKQIISDLQHII